MAGSRPADPVVSEAHRLSRDYIDYVTGRSAGPAPSDAALALRHAGDELTQKFPIFFKRWPRVFSGVAEDEVCDFLINLIDENFKEQRQRQRRRPGYPPDLPWSSVLSIYVLAGQMAVYCQENGMERAIGPLTERVGEYVEENVCPAVREKGGWDGFTKRFRRQENLEVKALKTCFAVLLVSSGLLLTVYLWRRKNT